MNNMNISSREDICQIKSVIYLFGNILEISVRLLKDACESYSKIPL